MTAPHDPKTLLSAKTPDAAHHVVITDHFTMDDKRIRFYLDSEEVGQFGTFIEALGYGRTMGYLHPLHVITAEK